MGRVTGSSVGSLVPHRFFWGLPKKLPRRSNAVAAKRGAAFFLGFMTRARYPVVIFFGFLFFKVFFEKLLQAGGKTAEITLRSISRKPMISGKRIPGGAVLHGQGETEMLGLHELSGGPQE
jgi:hypothetical protein